MKQLTRTRLRFLLMLALLAAILLDGVGWNLAGVFKARRFSQWPLEVPPDAFTAWQDRDPEQSLHDLDVQLQQMLQAAQNRAGAQEVLACFDQAGQTLAQIQTDQAFAQWAASRQVERFGESAVAWSGAANRAWGLYTQARQTLLEDDSSWELRAYLGEEGDDQTAAAYTPEQMDLLDQEAELVNQYNQMLGSRAERCTVTDRGVTYHEASLLAAYEDGTLSETDYQRLHKALRQEVNAQLGEVYLKLVKLRNDFARSLGYAHYAAYAYSNVYGRDYTPEAAADFCQRIMKLLAPLVARWKEAGEQPSLDLEALYPLLYGRSGEELAEMVRPYLKQISGELADVFSYMLDDGLLDAENLDSKTQGAYTADLPAYQSALIYLSPDDLDPFTLIHEFGHFADACLAPNLAPCMDSAEIASQGLETLYLSFAQNLVGAEHAAALRWMEGFRLLSVMMDAARLGAFELNVYTAQDLTVDQLDQYYWDLCAQSGEPSAIDDASYDWEMVPHLFESPCYYVSYGTSAANALELLLRSWKDFPQGADQYLNLVAQTDTQGYIGAVEAAGLHNMLEPKSLADLTQGLEDYLNQEICQAA